MQSSSDDLVIKCKDRQIVLKSRLLIGTGKYNSLQQTQDALIASGAEIITVAVRRVNIENRNEPLLQDYIDPKKYIYLPNTAGCFTALEAVRTLKLARELGGWNLVKLEVLSDPKTLYPNMIETISAAKELIKNGFDVMAYTTDDPVLCKILEEEGVCAIMPLGAPIGSGLGLQNKLNISFIIEQSKVPVIVDAGVGTPSDASIAMELGASGVLTNTAIAKAQNPVLMARAMKLAVESGRMGFLAGRIERKNYGSASSPITGKIE